MRRGRGEERKRRERGREAACRGSSPQRFLRGKSWGKRLCANSASNSASNRRSLWTPPLGAPFGRSLLDSHSSARLFLLLFLLLLLSLSLGLLALLSAFKPSSSSSSSASLPFSLRASPPRPPPRPRCPSLSVQALLVLVLLVLLTLPSACKPSSRPSSGARVLLLAACASSFSHSTLDEAAL